MLDLKGVAVTIIVLMSIVQTETRPEISGLEIRHKV